MPSIHHSSKRALFFATAWRIGSFVRKGIVIGMNKQQSPFPVNARVHMQNGMPQRAGEERSENANQSDNKGVVRAVVHDISRSGRGDETISVKLSQPVVGFVNNPCFECRSQSGEIVRDSFSRYRFTWYRSRKYYLCNSENCINMYSRENAASEMKCQCLTCLQFGNERLSYFCCPECMRRGWKSHCLFVSPPLFMA